MPPRTSRDLVPLLRGAPFRRVTMDGRTRLARAIPTLTAKGRRPGNPPTEPARHAAVLGRCQLENGTSRN
jgi:hypothetical protein